MSKRLNSSQHISRVIGTQKRYKDFNYESHDAFREQFVSVMSTKDVIENIINS